MPDISRLYYMSLRLLPEHNINLENSHLNSNARFMSQIEHSELDLRLKRLDRVYRPGGHVYVGPAAVKDVVQGYVVIKAKGGWSHQGIQMKVEGSARLETSTRAGGMLDAVYGNVKPLDIMAEDIDIASPGRVPEGITEIPFEFELRGINGKPLFETYHGVYVNVLYLIAVDCDRGVLKKMLHREVEFNVEVPTQKKPLPGLEPVAFTITPESLENVQAVSLKQIPKFKISGKLHQSNWPITQPFTGEVVVESSETAIKSIELQLVRVESIICNDNTAREATEIQNIQIGEDNLCRQCPIPLYMVFPRLFTCATMLTNRFRVEFEVNLIIVFADNYMVTECFPLTLHRPANK